MQLKFWGAARTVTGSMHLLELSNGTKILLDCGIYQGMEGFANEYNRSFPCDPAEIEYLILSHAHIDHCGNIPQLVKMGFRGRIFCTHATYDLCSIMLQDSAEIQEKDAEYDNKHRARKGLPPIKPLYTTDDVAPALAQFVALPYNMPYRVCKEVEFTFLDAGHMLGSASVNIVIREGRRTVRLGFTGDIGRPGRPILRDPVKMHACDYLISESTYGGKDHDEAPIAEETLLRIVTETCIERRGKLIIPAFSVGRTQDLLHAFDQMSNNSKLPPVKVWLDSPLAIEATRIFQAHPDCFDEDLIRYMHTDPDPFGFNRLHIVRTVEESKMLNHSKEPGVIISASGMVSAGRIVHHVKHNIEDANNTILLVGYCAKGTLGERLASGEPRVRIHGEELTVRARIEKISAYSGHAGQQELYEFIRKSQDPKKIKRIYLVHGEEERAVRFSNFLTANGYKTVIVPMRGETMEI